LLAQREAEEIDALRRHARAHRREVLRDIHRLREVADRVVEVDHEVEVRAELVGRSAHVAHKHLRAALRQARSCERDGALLEVATRDLGPVA
jgi:hypothetical protein